MSKLGETADNILEKLNSNKKVQLIDADILETDEDILDFMKDCGLIELKNGEVRITGLGSDLLKVK